MAKDASDQWRAWLGRHGPALVLFARQWSASHADADDAVQDGFIRFWQSRSRARDETAYLYACVKSAAMDLSRAGQRRERRELAATAGVDVLLQTNIERDEQRQLIENALVQLPSKQREVLVMKIWGGLTFLQIAESLDVSPNTVASRYRYAIARLETELAEEVANERKL